jgi:hypothetical protein
MTYPACLVVSLILTSVEYFLPNDEVSGTMSRPLYPFQDTQAESERPPVNRKKGTG